MKVVFRSPSLEIKVIPGHTGFVSANVLRVLRHHAQPEVRGMPLAITLLWYNVGYGTLAMVKGTIKATDLPKGKESLALASAAALAATSLDLLLDPLSLDLGLWEWSGGDPYASEVEGPNGDHGVPMLNFAG